MWEITKINKVNKSKKGILIEGLPGIGNSGKIAVDYIIEQLKARDILSFYSYHLPNSAFVNKNSLIEIPKLRIAYSKIKQYNLFFLYGDIQPIDEVSSHSFTNEILKFCNETNITEIITLGGIGMHKIQSSPKVYISGNNKEIIKKYSTPETREKILGVVGPVFGATGLLVGLAGKYNIDAVSYLVQSFAHPLHVGIKEANELLKILDRKLNIGINLKKFQKDIAKVEKEQKLKIKDLTNINKQKENKEMSYIG